MKTFFIVIASLLIGAAVGGYLALSVGAGMGAGAGIVVGTQAGACLAVEAAKDRGLLTADQVDEVLNGAVAKIADGAKFPPEAKLIGGEADCAKVVADLKNGVQNQQK